MEKKPRVKRPRINISPEVRLYAFQIKREYHLDDINNAYHIIMTAGMKFLQQNKPSDYIPHDSRGRKRKDLDIYIFSIPVKKNKSHES